ncbi:hemerythrin domain-containing protein [Geodermatophilus sp. TF02-6]|uniref:hemerythrin domain-containing protein n=1 Tax=Geodermatophilus sp. TF02-6 TaxID=2250575 RepID=UPI0011BF4C47|nr:hemerythrin domain-containing protein [Geodermatophilus sp. TF02-6]
MPTRDQVLAALDGGTDYAAAAARLGVHPGLAYLIATGFPADGSDVVTAEEQRRPGVLPGSSQHLANPAVHAPDAGGVVHAWLRRRAQGDAQMAAAARARTATPGPQNDPGSTTDVVTVLTRQHDAATSLVKQLDAIPGRSRGGTPAQASERESIVDMIGKALAAHETSEEEHLWPRVRELLPDGDRWADGGLQQEQEATETLSALSRADPQTEEFDDLVEELMPRLHRHVAYEDRLFLQLRRAVPDEERARMGERILAAQRDAPTRPHPDAPREPGPAVAAAARSAAPVDRARDATGRPADREGRPDPGAPG